MASVTVQVVGFVKGATSSIVNLSFDNVTFVISAIQIINNGPAPLHAKLTQRSSGKTVEGTIAANSSNTLPVTIADGYTVLNAQGGLGASSAKLETDCHW